MHSGSPWRLAEVAVMGSPKASTTALGIAASGTRRATLPVLAVLRSGSRELALTMIVSGPGQKTLGEPIKACADIARQFVGLRRVADQQRQGFVAHARLDFVNAVDRPQIDGIDRQAVKGVRGKTDNTTAAQAGDDVFDTFRFRFVRVNAKDFRRQDFSRKFELRRLHWLAGTTSGRGGKIAAMPPASQHRLSRIVQSRQNRRVKELRASFSPARADLKLGLIGIEGEHLLAEALRSRIRIATVFFRSPTQSDLGST